MLGGGLRREEVAEPFDLARGRAVPFAKARRVNSPGSAMPQPGHAAKRIEHCPDGGDAAMQLQLDHVLAREAPRPREGEHEGLVEHVPRRRVAQAT